jgi:hypothetical protein
MLKRLSPISAKSLSFSMLQENGQFNAHSLTASAAKRERPPSNGGILAEEVGV